MSGAASWCESVGPVDSVLIKKSVAARRSFSEPRRLLSYPVSINTDDDFNSSTFSDEEESRTIRDLILNMSAPNPFSSVSENPISDTSGNSSPSKSGFVRGESQPQAKNRSHLMSASASDPIFSTGSLSSYQGYGAIQIPPASEYCSRRSSMNNNDGNTRIEGGNDLEGDSIQKLPFFMISLIVMFTGVSSKFHTTLVDQYVYQRFANDIIGNETHTASDPCFHESQANNSQTALVKHVQDLSSRELLFLDLILYGLGIPACIILGMLSRSISRKLQLFIPLFGYNFKNAGLVVMVYLNPGLNWFYLPYAVEGLTGNYVGVLLGLFLYTSDISGRSRSRTTAMVIIEGVRGGTTAALNVAAGQLIQYSGFKLPAWISLASSAVALLLIFALPNRKPPLLLPPAHIQDEGHGSLRKWMSVFFFPAGTFNNKTVKKLFTSGLIAALLFFVAALGMKKVQSLYLMNEPICWSSSLIGWFLFGGDLSSNMFTIFIGPLLIRCLPGMIVGILGMLSLSAGSIFLALATRGFELYFQPVVAIGQQLPMGIIRGELSRLVGSEAQGTLFATIAVMESFSFALGASFLYVYNATLGFYKGTVALLATGMFFFGAWVLLYFHRIWLSHYRDSYHAQPTKSEEENRISAHT